SVSWNGALPAAANHAINSAPPPKYAAARVVVMLNALEEVIVAPTPVGPRGKLVRAPCWRLWALRSQGPLLRSRHHPRKISLDETPRQSARGHRRPSDDRARLPARRGRRVDRPGHRRDRRRTHR